MCLLERILNVEILIILFIPSAFDSYLLAIMAPIGFGSYCTLKLLFSRVTVLPPRVTVLPQV
jgi:hypothetical protein